jgi:NAD+ diphosphatase
MPFSGNPLDRASNQRRDEAWIQRLLEAQDSRFLPFHRLNVLTHHSEQPGLLWLDSSARRHVDGDGSLLLLGVMDGAAHFAVDFSSLPDPIVDLGLEGATFSEARGIALELPPAEAGIVAHARSLLDWHNRNGFCSACGSPTRPKRAGGMRKCEACGAEHFPRTDPVVIMVVWRGDKCLLGRRPGRPAGNFSTLAGFIEQGETIEEAVRREVFEEVGVQVDDVAYYASQPWPFPSSLMIGCFAHATSDAYAIDEEEIAEARWFTREEVQQAVAAPSPDPGLIVPNQVAIAHHLLKAWSELP